MFDAPIPADTVLTARLTAQEWNVVLAGLMELPYRVSSSVINRLNEQLRMPQEAGHGGE